VGDADFDLVVVGAGNAGLAAAGAAREAGWRVAVIEARDVGGTCPLRGCVPKKVLVAAAEALEAIARAGEHGIEVGPARLDWAALIARKGTFVAGVPEDFTRSLERRGIEVVAGRARFVAPDAVEVNGRRLRARHFVVATGSRPRPLGVPGEALAITSDEFLELAAQPRRAVFIGGGIIAMEFAHVLARAGTKVTILARDARLLKRFDAVLVGELVRVGDQLGIDTRYETRATALERQGEAIAVTCERAGRREVIEADLVVNAAGRAPALADLDLPAADISLERGRPRLEPTLRASDNPRVWFAGDAHPGAPQLSPVATWQGQAIGHNLLHPESPRVLSYDAVPSCVFTVPTLASVGRDEPTARAAGLDVEVNDQEMSGWRSSRTYAERAARSRIVLERGSGRIVGAAVLGHGAGEIIHTFALAVARGLTAADLKDQVFAYPTFNSDIRHMI
jgi:glutathione reductase (NADPH)